MTSMRKATDRTASPGKVLVAALCAALFLAGCGADKKGPELVRDGAFERFTVYTDDGRDRTEFAPAVILLLHGYQSAMPNDDYDAIVDLFGDSHTVVGFNYDYTDVDADKQAFEEVYEHYLKDRKVVVLGTSLGGYWADYILTHYPVAGAVLVNPALDPGSVLRGSLGTHKGDRRQEAFTVTEDHAKAYDDMNWAVDGQHGSRLVLIADDDELLDPSRADERFGRATRTKVLHFSEGGHNIALNRPEVVDALRGFINAVAPGEPHQRRLSAVNQSEPLVPAPVTIQDPALQPGLTVDYYYAKMNRVDALRGLIRSREGETGPPIQALNYVGNEGAVLTSKASDMVGARIHGFLKVETPGLHFFRVTSNDGVELWIAGNKLHSDPKVHADRTSPIIGADFPAPGMYPIEILYFEKKGVSTLKLEWREPGAGKLSVVPADALYYLSEQ